MALIDREMRNAGATAYREDRHGGLMRYLQLFVDRQTEKIQLALIVNSPAATPELDRLCDNLMKYDLWHSVWLNFHPEASNRVLGESWKLVKGNPFLWQTLNRTQIAFHPGAFSQNHLSLFEKMLVQIESWVEPKDRVLEMYAGVGAIGLGLVHKTSQLRLVENNPFAEISFRESVQKIPDGEREKIQYRCEEAENYWTESDLIIVDPPRKGLEKPLLEKLCRAESSRLIYVSCGFESFQRDCAALLSAGWKLQEAQGYLLFPGTDQIETLALFRK